MSCALIGMSRHEVPLERLPAAGGRTLLRLEGRCLVLFRVEDEYIAIDDSCPHQGASLFGGKLEGGAVQCPAHGLRFDLRSGCLRNAPQLRVPVYPIDIEQGRVFICLPGQDSL
jgi:nitrite reductase/ring-hydroxylating ferredoxin subunit